jgi:hypothetical protein
MATVLRGDVGKPGFGFCCSALLRLAALLEAIAFAVHLQNMDMMCKPVQASVEPEHCPRIQTFGTRNHNFIAAKANHELTFNLGQ